MLLIVDALLQLGEAKEMAPASHMMWMHLFVVVASG
jgi:hypothetical protein